MEGVRSNTLSDREKMIGNIIADVIGNDVIVHDSNNNFKVLETSEIFEYVKKGFTQKVSVVNKKGANVARVKQEKKVATSSSVSKKMDNLPRKNRLESKSVQIKKEKTKPFDSRFNFAFRYSSIPIFEGFYEGQEEHQGALSKNWNMFSMIHNLYDSNRLVVYNGSHRVANYGTIHYKSRVVLNFPNEPNMFVLFHGNLVHSGAASKFEDNPFAMNYASDYRAFAYIDKFGNKNKDKPNPRKCRVQNNKVEKRGTHEDSITTTTFRCCDKLKGTDYPCQICDRHNNIFIKNDGFTLDLGEAYKEYCSKPKSKSIYLEPIVGDLKQFGWAVYEGIDTRNVVEVGSLFQDLRDLIYRLKIQTGIDWVQIQNPKPALESRGAGRWQLKISSTHLDPETSASNTNEYLKSIVSFYKKLQIEKLSKIEGFQDVKIDEGHLLRNTGCLSEQKCHKDFELIESE